MGNEILLKTMKYLTSSVENNKVTDVNKLTLAIDELENFPMTFDMLDDSRVGQILQSIRHSKEITIFLSERIRSLIKCWRQLLSEDVISVIPSQIKSILSKTPAVKNGYSNGYVMDKANVQIEIPENYENNNSGQVNFKYKRKSPITEIQTNVIVGSELSGRNIFNSLRTDNNFFPQTESQNVQKNQVRKPKVVKSTKDLLADFSQFIETDLKDKILTDKINQEADDQLSYFPVDNYAVSEMFHYSIYNDKNQGNTSFYETSNFDNYNENEEIEFGEPYESQDVGPPLSHCEMLLKEFTNMCSQQPQLIVSQMVPWDNMTNGLPLPAPIVRIPRKRYRPPRNTPKKETPLSLDFINEMLESFEVRTQQKQMIVDAINERKQKLPPIDNTKSLQDVSLKLKLKLPTKAIVKARRKKRRKKIRKPKVKLFKERVKRPRKLRIKAMPPVTNYLDDIPSLPPLKEDICEVVAEEEDSETPRAVVEFTEENARLLAYGIIEGHTCTRHTVTGERVLLTSMYSHIIRNHYLHIFPWVDLISSSRSTFPSQYQELLHSLMNLSPL